MLKYIGKRLLLMLPVLLGISFILFTIMDFTPGDPARMILGEYASQEEVDALRECSCYIEKHTAKLSQRQTAHTIPHEIRKPL